MRETSLVAHWPLHGNATDVGGKHHGAATNGAWTAGPDGSAAAAALFNGRDSVIEVPHDSALDFECRDFTVAAWVKCAIPMQSVCGDVLSKFDPQRRCGLNLWIAGNAPGYNSMADARHVHFGIDDGYLGQWEDCGRPSPSNPLVTYLMVYQGELYGGIADAAEPADACRVFRWAGGTEWEDCGRLGNNPDHRSVMSLYVHGGKLYAATGIWDWVSATAAANSQPPRAPSHVFCYEGGTTWRDLGQVGHAVRVLCMASFGGELYVGLDRFGGGGIYKYSRESWVHCGVLGDFDNCNCLMPLGGALYAASHLRVFRYEGGTKWTCIGDQPYGISQIHSFQVVAGKLWVGTWPQGYVLRYEGHGRWTNTGTLGMPLELPGTKERPQINEINALAVHNGKLYAGVLPKAEVYRYESDGQWTLLGSLASRADWHWAVTPSWLRVLTLTTHQGRLFACTGAGQARVQDVDPDQTVGRVLACQVGQVVSHEHDLGGDWTHLAGVRQGRTLRLYVNGQLSAKSDAPKGRHFNLLNAAPLRIGFGAQSSFDGAISDVRLHGRALSAEDLSELHRCSGQSRKAIAR